MEEIRIQRTLLTPKEIIAKAIFTTANQEISKEFIAELESDINNLIEKNDKQVHSDIKRIISHNFGKQRNKKRISDQEKNLELINHLGSALTVIESEVKDDTKRYLIGKEPIFSIVPKRDHEKDEIE